MERLLQVGLCLNCIFLVASFQQGPKTTNDDRSSVSSLPTFSVEADTASHSTDNITPNEFFRYTEPGEVSVVSMNILAPSYNSLSIDSWDERTEFLKRDREERVPLAIQMAKQHNADILCLQEVEGGTNDLEAALKRSLEEPLQIENELLSGYDMFLWTSLLPKREDNVVGNCIAWRSSRHSLAAVDCFKRGMICQMTEVHPNDKGGTFCVANVHLPAKPSNIMGRLKTISKTIQKMSRYDKKERKSPLDGLFIVAGDFNCDQNSVTAKLLTTGYSPYGNLKDRNYKANVSKASALMMKHDYRFKDVYEDRRDIAPVTVSLSGRGPGCMDQLFFAQASRASKASKGATQRTVEVAANPKPPRKGGKRRVRRQRVAWVQSRRIIQLSLPTAIRVESVLATISGPDDTQRLETIYAGLPNVEKGFPSDHVPIGALFVPDNNISTNTADELEAENTDTHEMKGNEVSLDESSELRLSSGVSSNVARRREAATLSVGVRRRHNAVLQCVTKWLTERGAYDIHCDEPLYKLKYTKDVTKLKKKSRAPDLVCSLGKSLVVIEITVSAQPDSARRSKLKKYEDLSKVLEECPSVQDAGLTVQCPFVILLDEYGGIPEETKHDILELARLTSFSSIEEQAEADAQRFCNHLQGIFNEMQ
eukprot:scaffold4204_cov140-Cylindrotheca_fusiformis.AAC.4